MELRDRSLVDKVLKEAHERTTYLDDDDPDHIESLLLFLYTNEYPTSSAMMRHGRSTSANLLIHASMYRLAKKYEAPDLQTAAAKAFIKLQFSGPSEVGDMRFLYELIVEVYKTTTDADRTLRDPLQRFLASEPSRYLARRSVQEFASENKEFAADVLKSYFENIRLAGKYWCVTCGSYMSNVKETEECRLGHALRDI